MASTMDSGDLWVAELLRVVNNNRNDQIPPADPKHSIAAAAAIYPNVDDIEKEQEDDDGFGSSVFGGRDFKIFLPDIPKNKNENENYPIDLDLRLIRRLLKKKKRSAKKTRHHREAKVVQQSPLPPPVKDAQPTEQAPAQASTSGAVVPPLKIKLVGISIDGKRHQYSTSSDSVLPPKKRYRYSETSPTRNDTDAATKPTESTSHEVQLESSALKKTSSDDGPGKVKKFRWSDDVVATSEAPPRHETSTTEPAHVQRSESTSSPAGIHADAQDQPVAAKVKKSKSAKRIDRIMDAMISKVMAPAAAAAGGGSTKDDSTTTTMKQPVKKSSAIVDHADAVAQAVPTSTRKLSETSEPSKAQPTKPPIVKKPIKTTFVDLDWMGATSVVKPMVKKSSSSSCIKKLATSVGPKIDSTKSSTSVAIPSSVNDGASSAPSKEKAVSNTNGSSTISSSGDIQPKPKELSKSGFKIPKKIADRSVSVDSSSKKDSTSASTICVPKSIVEQADHQSKKRNREESSTTPLLVAKKIEKRRKTDSGVEITLVEKPKVKKRDIAADVVAKSSSSDPRSDGAQVDSTSPKDKSKKKKKHKREKEKRREEEAGTSASKEDHREAVGKSSKHRREQVRTESRPDDDQPSTSAAAIQRDRGKNKLVHGVKPISGKAAIPSTSSSWWKSYGRKTVDGKPPVGSPSAFKRIRAAAAAKPAAPARILFDPTPIRNNGPRHPFDINNGRFHVQLRPGPAMMVIPEPYHEHLVLFNNLTAKVSKAVRQNGGFKEIEKEKQQPTADGSSTRVSLLPPPRFANREPFRRFHVVPGKYSDGKKLMNEGEAWQQQYEKTKKSRLDMQAFDDEMKAMEKNRTRYDEIQIMIKNVLHLYLFTPNSVYGDFNNLRCDLRRYQKTETPMVSQLNPYVEMVIQGLQGRGLRHILWTPPPEAPNDSEVAGAGAGAAVVTDLDRAARELALSTARDYRAARASYRAPSSFASDYRHHHHHHHRSISSVYTPIDEGPSTSATTPTSPMASPYEQQQHGGSYGSGSDPKPTLTPDGQQQFGQLGGPPRWQPPPAPSQQRPSGGDYQDYSTRIW